MKIAFAKLSPGGNTTILLDMPAPEGPMRASLANALMHPLHLGGEQVGYMNMDGVSLPSLEMMGGEFCGNAARSFAAVLVMRGHPSIAWDETKNLYFGHIRVSGANGPVPVSVSAREVPASFCAHVGGMRMAYEASVRVSVPQEVAGFLHRVESGMDVVALEGITHVLLDAARHPMSADYSGQCARIRAALGLELAEAVGCIWYTREESGLRIDPVVWVRGTQSTHYETGCGSGSVALGLLETVRTGSAFSGHVLQPSGQTICASIEYSPEGGFSGAWIGGEVRLVAEGQTLLA